MIDIQGAFIYPEVLPGYSGSSSAQEINYQVINEIIERLVNAKKPLILAGHGVRMSGGTALFRKIMEQLNIPIVTTQLGKDILEYEHTLFVGHPGMKGDRAGNFAIQNADVILCLGSSLHVLTTGYELDQFAPKAYKIQVELDENVLAREEVGVQQKLQMDINDFLKSVAINLKESDSFSASTWHKQCQKWKNELAVKNEPHQKSEKFVDYYEVIESLNEFMPEQATLVADAGSAFYVAGHAFRVKKNQRVVISGALGSMGYALPAATGASLADPTSLVVCLTGDGSLQTNIHELATIKHNKLNIKMIIVNNSGYISIRNTQNNFFNGHMAGVAENTGVSFPHLEKLAEAYGLPYHKIAVSEKLNSVMGTVLKSDGPVICEIFANPDQQIIPTVSSQKQADGRMVSKPLDDMFPFMDEKTRQAYLIVE